MSRTVAHSHDNILTPEERAKSARKCLDIIKGHEDLLDPKSKIFVGQQQQFRNNVGFAPSHVQLDWLRDLAAMVTDRS